MSEAESYERAIANESVAISEAQIVVGGKLYSKYYTITKRFFDIIAGSFGCIATIPLLALVKIVYLIHGDTAPVLFAQNRIGKNGKEFKFYKIRTMYIDADQRLEELLKTDEDLAAEYAKNKKLKNDPRITKAGKIFRKSSLDEFPQFFNVLKGDMSIVGNRPYMPREKCDIRQDQFNLIIKTKPGITGFWQVSGRSNISFTDRVRMEALYSEYANLKMDTQIFLKTFLSVLRKDGAD